MTPLLQLLNELVKRGEMAQAALDGGEDEAFADCIERCIRIVRYLDETLDNEYEISSELHRLYDFFAYDLDQIQTERNGAELQRLCPMFADLRDSFSTAEQTAQEEAEGGA